MKITVDGDELTIDYTGSDTRPEIQAWSTFGNTRGYTVGQIASMMDPEIPKNEGFFDQIKLVVPAGLRPQPHAGQARECRDPPPGRGRRRGHRGRDAARAARQGGSADLQDRHPHRSSSGSTPQPARRSPTTRPRSTPGWCNAAKGMDAWGAQNASFGNLWKATAEINESLYPHVQWSRDYRTDSGGPGQWRGLCGSHYEKEVLVDAKVYTYVVGMKYPMPGICGGEPGEPNEMMIRYGSDDPFVVQAHRGLGADPRRPTHHVRLRRGRWLGRSPRPRSPGRARRRARRVRQRRTCRARLRRRAHRLARGPHARGRHDAATAAASASSVATDEVPRSGVDVGGTFTDLICVTDTGEVLLDKTPTTLDDQSTRRHERAWASSPTDSGITLHDLLRRSSTSSCTAPPRPTTR